ncbi:MAG: hypothetical protein U9Q85_02405 [Patescibacteria group bacterium]|nr:hypothetical protein [Patescibacteria group bacterium]
MRFLACKNLTYIIIAVLAIFVMFGFAFSVVDAEGVQSAIDGLVISGSQAFDGSKVKEGPKNVITNIPEAIGNVVGAILAFIGVLFLGLMIYGGFIWMNARGNDADTKKARDIIEAAVIGLIIVLAAYVIAAYVGGVLFNPPPAK